MHDTSHLHHINRNPSGKPPMVARFNKPERNEPMNLHSMHTHSAAPTPARVAQRLTIPNERTRRIVVDVAENVQTYGEVFKRSKELDEVALATFRGAFLALTWSADPAASDFGEKALQAVNEGGYEAISLLLTMFQAGEHSPSN